MQKQLSGFKRKNITPAALIDVIAEIIFIVHYGSKDTRDIIWMCVAIVIVVVIIVFNLFKYGLKDGTFASFAELVFSISAAFLILCAIVASGQNSKKRERNNTSAIFGVWYLDWYKLHGRLTD